MKNENSKAVVTLGDIDNVTIVQTANGKIASVSNSFTFSRLTGLAQTLAPDGSITQSWQCNLVIDSTNTVVGWAWPAVLQADLPEPDVTEVDLSNNQVGKGYSSPITGYWDVPVKDLIGNITHYGAKVMLPDGNYVEVTDLNNNFSYYLLAI